MNDFHQSITKQSLHFWNIVEQIKSKEKAYPKVNIVGFSQGGVFAYHMAAQNPTQLRSLTLCFTPLEGLTFNKKIKPKPHAIDILILHNQDDKSVNTSHTIFAEQLIKREKNIRVVVEIGKNGGHALTEKQIIRVREHLRDH